MNLSKTLLLAALFISSYFSFADRSVKVICKSTDDVSFLYYRYGNYLVPADTARYQNGAFDFSIKDSQPLGMYVFMNKKSEEVFEFICIEPKIVLTLAGNNVNASESKENKLLFSIRKYAQNRSEEAIEKRQKKLIGENEGTFFSKLMQAELLPTEEELSDQNNIIKSWFKNVDFKDERLVYSTAYQNMLDFFFDEMIGTSPEAFTKNANKLIDILPKNEFYKFTLNHLAFKAETSQNECFGTAYLALLKDYFLSGKASWVSNDQMNKIKAKYNQVEKLACGEIMPDLVLQNEKGQDISIKQFNTEFTVVVFFDPTCSHCKEVLDALAEQQKDLKKNLTVITVMNSQDKDEWKKTLENPAYKDFIHLYDKADLLAFRENFGVERNPTIYLLDKEKRIILSRAKMENVGRTLLAWYLENK